MKLVKQQEFGLCGPACLATILNKDLYDIVQKFTEHTGKDPRQTGMTDEEIIDFLLLEGYENVKNEFYLKDSSRPAICTVASLNHLGLLHYIVWDGKKYLDPGVGRTYPNDAPKLNGESVICIANIITWDVSVGEIYCPLCSGIEASIDMALLCDMHWEEELEKFLGKK